MPQLPESAHQGSRCFSLVLALVSGLSLLQGSADAACNATNVVPKNRCWETSIIAAAPAGSTNPYREILLRASYKRKDGTGPTYEGYGFWDGTSAGNYTFKIRASFPEVGDWLWSTSCSGTGCVPGLTKPFDNTRFVQVTPPGSNTPPIIRQGPLVIAASQAPSTPQYLKHRSGTPFYWLGDTAWFTIYRDISATEWTNYLTNRWNAGFTVIQISTPISGGTLQPTMKVAGTAQTPFVQVPGCTSSAALPNSCSTLNLPFWRQFDDRVQQANDTGLVVVLIGLYKRVIEGPNDNGKWPLLGESQTYARNLVARLSGSHVIFSPGFDGLPARADSINEPRSTCAGKVDTTGPNRVNEACRARFVGREIRRAIIKEPSTNPAETWLGTPFSALVTHHIGGGCSDDCTASCPCSCTPCLADYWLAEFQKETWLDLQLFQSGQGGNCPAVNGSVDPTHCAADRAITRPLALWNNSARRVPLADAEGPYNTQGTTMEPFTSLRVRQVGYLAGLSGAFGYTFGDNNVWQTGTGLPLLATTSVGEMTRLCTLFRSVPWERLIPAHDRIVDTDNTSFPAQKKRVFAIDFQMPRRFGVAYVPASVTGIQLNLDPNEFQNLATWHKTWFDPRNDNNAPATLSTVVVGTAAVSQFTKPTGWEDALLILKDNAVFPTGLPTARCPCKTAPNGTYICTTPP